MRTSQTMPRPEGSSRAGRCLFSARTVITSTQRDVILSAARVALSSRRGSLADQITRAEKPDAAAIPRGRRPRGAAPPAPLPEQAHPELEFFNGLGGFARGRARVSRSARARTADAGAHGSMSSPMRGSDAWYRSRARDAPGQPTARRTGSPPGQTTPSAIHPARCSMSATRRPAISGAQRPSRSARIMVTTWRATAADTPGPSMTRMASRSSCSSSCLLTIP